MAAEPCAKFNREKIVFVLAVTYPAKIIGREGIRAANAAFGQNGQTCWVRYRAWLFARRIARIRIGRVAPGSWQNRKYQCRNNAHCRKDRY